MTQFVSQIRTDKFNKNKTWTESASDVDSFATKKWKREDIYIKGQIKSSTYMRSILKYLGLEISIITNIKG